MAVLRSDLVMSLIDRVSKPAMAVSRSIDRLEGRTKLAFTGMVGAAAPLVGAFAGTAIVKQAADFESALTNIQKKAGITAEETARLGEEIKDLASSGEIAVPIEDIAAAYERGAAAGLQLDALRDFAALSVKAADGFEMSAEEVGNFAAKLQTGLGMTKKEVQEVFDLTNSLADAGISDERNIVDYMDRVGASLKTLGLAKEQSLALGATLLNIGMTADVAATGTDALTNNLLSVSRLTGAKRKTFQKYMGSVEDFAGIVEKDANAALLKMLDTLKGLNKTDRIAFLTDFVGKEHASKMLRLAESVEEYRRNLALAADQAKWAGSLDASYELKLDDFWSQWQIARNGLQELMIDAGTFAMPALKTGLEEARSLFETISENFKSFEAKVDIAELKAAKQSLGELMGLMQGLMAMGGSENTAIERFFSRLATAADLVSGSINLAKDAAQHLGLAEPDADTEQTRSERRGKLVEDYLDFNPVARFVKDRLFGEEEEASPATPEPKSTPKGDRPQPTLRPEIDLRRFGSEAADAVDVPVPAPRPEKRSRPALRPATVPPSPAPQAPAAAPALPKVPPVPTPRPEIDSAVREEGEKAVSSATAIGERIKQAFDIVATPQVDTRSIDAAQRKVNALAASMRELRGMSLAGGNNDGLFADTGR